MAQSFFGRKMKKYILIIVFFMGCTGLHIENDILDKFNKNKDIYFTHGTRFNYDTEEANKKTSYAIGQNIYTPSTKRPDADPEVLRRDRPYTAWLYGEYRETYQLQNDSETWGIQAGCTGSCALGKETQQGAHRLLGQGKPSWNPDFKLKSEPGFIGEYERYHSFYTQGETQDAKIYGVGKVGNIVDSAGIGLVYRYGHNLDVFPSTPIVFKTYREYDPWTYYGFVDAQNRFVLYNHLLDGSLFQKERHTVNSEPLVQEGKIGFTVGYKKFKFTYTYIIFSKEWTTQPGSFSFGSLDFAW